MKDQRTTKLGDHQLSPQSLMMGYGYNPKLSEGSLKPPIFLTSTFVFDSCADGKRFSRELPTNALAGRKVLCTAVSTGRIRQLGITDNLVRVSIGIESAEDLVADFTQALKQV